VNDLEDYRAFRDALSHCTAPARVAILGGGLIGCEFANDLAIAGHAVQVIDIAPQALGRLLPSDLPGAVRGPAQALQQALQQTGVQWHLSRSLKTIQHSATASTLELQLDNGDCLEADLVLSAVGLAPRTALAASAGLQIGRGIVTNHCLQTSARHVYALGDCAEVNGMLLPYVMPIMHGARALAATLASYQDTNDSVQAQSVHYPPMPVSVKTPALPITVCSPAMGSAGAWVACLHSKCRYKRYRGALPVTRGQAAGLCPDRHSMQPAQCAGSCAGSSAERRPQLIRCSVWLFWPRMT
jgi:rubredoxin-NAD+ reductase